MARSEARRNSTTLANLVIQEDHTNVNLSKVKANKSVRVKRVASREFCELSTTISHNNLMKTT